MKWIQIILADYIRRGKVTLEIPGLNMDELRKDLHTEADRHLREAINILCDDDLTDQKKVAQLQVLLL